MQIKYSDKSVLVVEHNQESLSLLKHTLNLLGFTQVLSASSVNMALSLMRSMPFDLCIAGYDLAKDEKVGLQLLQEAREEGVFSHQGLFLLVLDPARASLLKSALVFAPDSYVTLPLEPPKLRNRLDKLWRVKLVTAQIEQLRDQKDFGKAARACDLVAKRYPGLQVYLDRLKGITLLQAKRTEEAKSVFLGLSQRPNLTWAVVGAGIALYDQGEYPASQKALQQVVDRQQMGVEVFFWLAKALQAQGLNKQALNLLRKAVMLQPSIALLQKALAETAEQNQQWRLALEAYQKGLAYSRYSVFQHPDLYLAVIYAMGQLFEGQDVAKWRQVEQEILTLSESLLQDYEGDEQVALSAKLMAVEAFKAANAVEKSVVRARDAWSMFSQLTNEKQCEWLPTIEQVLTEPESRLKVEKRRAELVSESEHLPDWFALWLTGLSALKSGDLQKAYLHLRKSAKALPEHSGLSLQWIDAGLGLLESGRTKQLSLLHDCEKQLFSLSYAGMNQKQKTDFGELQQRCAKLRSHLQPS
ncbi:MAG: tetratricopeptide repeat protein [Pontibacterium sp.]